MIPNSVSATSLETARTCLARYVAENIEYARSWQNNAAALGSAFHDAAERYVDMVYVKKTHEPSAERLAELFEMVFPKWIPFDNAEHDKFLETGLAFCATWSERESGYMDDGRTIISLEQKKSFDISTSVGPIKCNYILDRLDKIGPGVYEIVDYKTSIKNERPATIRRKLQPWIYACSVFIEYPDAERVLITFDMIRYDRVTIEVTKSEAREFYESVLLNTLEEKIIPTPQDDPPETLNLSCNYCIRKATCKTLQKNIDVGGIFSLDLQQQIDLRTEIELKLKGMNQLIKDLDEVVETALGQELTLELSTGRSRAYFTTKANNKIASLAVVESIVGSELFARYAKTTLTLEQHKKLIKDPALTDDQREQLKAQVIKEYGEPRLNYENERSDSQNEAIAQRLPQGPLVAASAPAPILGLD